MGKAPKIPSKEDIEDLKFAEHMRDLVNTPGWKVYEKVLQKHIDAKVRELCMPLHPIYTVDPQSGQPNAVMGDGIAHVLVGESAKGAIMGLRLALTLPSGIITGAEEIRKRLNPSDAEVTE
jgi:hypothetical protein